MHFFLAIILVSLSFLAKASVSPVFAQAKTAKNPMVFSVVRSNEVDCEPTCAEWITADGKIEKGASAGLLRVIRSLKGKKLPILINSSGGDVSEGLKMGQIIRANGLDVMVAKTQPDVECAANDAACLKQSKAAKGPRLSYFNFNSAQCSSACTFVLAGGVRRVAMAGTSIGVHQVTATQTRRIVYRRFHVERRRINGRWVEVSRRQISERVVSQKTIKLKSAPNSTNRSIEAHFNKMGIDQAFFALTMATPADSIRYLSRWEVQSQRVGTHVLTDILSVRPGSPRPQIIAAKAAPVVFPAIAPLTPKEDMSSSGKVGALSLIRTGNPKPFAGILMLGNLSSEFTIEPSHPSDTAVAFLRLIQDRKAISNVGNNVALNFFESNFKIQLLPADEGHGSRPLIGKFDRNKLCSLDPTTQMTISLRQQPNDQLRWMQIASVSELLPWVGIRASLCP